MIGGGIAPLTELNVDDDKSNQKNAMVINESPFVIVAGDRKEPLPTNAVIITSSNVKQDKCMVISKSDVLPASVDTKNDVFESDISSENDSGNDLESLFGFVHETVTASRGNITSDFAITIDYNTKSDQVTAGL